ncbi:hypothetical protein QN372_19690 [Undibacterium sp. RTI2.1]|uniref:hypothetical protein n=1 Tax=unclassified Undibacterium TaxID=2630295 RepID=UPI002B22AF88|nr:MULTISPECIES: hypothetical protein [unclassified Undibacterium]MEB0032975.1 hypothetical protein [Undibacterium sp. RTI2.1]MEB0118852.1 hypothetical protein [Undibacterium sp. RTI2.2]
MGSLLAVSIVFNATLLIAAAVVSYRLWFSSDVIEDWEVEAIRLRNSKDPLDQVKYALGYAGGGVHKRIDENRELLEFLLEEIPGFIDKNTWVEGWIKSNDDFFVAIEKTVPIAQGTFYSAQIDSIGKLGFPRPWPKVGRNTG